MKKDVFKKYYILKASLLGLSGLVISHAKAYAEIKEEYFVAGVGASDLFKFVSDHPKLFWTLLAVLVVFFVGYGIYYFAKKRSEKN